MLAENQLGTDDTVYGVAAVRNAFLVRTGHEVIKIATVPAQVASVTKP